MSQAAATQLSDPRFRRLLGIELQDTAVLSPTMIGPIADHVAYVWIDLPEPSIATLEVRVGAGPLIRRSIQLSGMNWDVAARLVAIALAETIRSQPVRTRKPPPQKTPSPEQLELAARNAPVLSWTGAVTTAAVSDGTVLGGTAFELGVRSERVGALLMARWVGGERSSGSVGWLEVGLGANVRWWLGPNLRLALGGFGAAASVHLGGVRHVDDIPASRDSGSARAGVNAALEMRLAEGRWLSIGLEPSAILRPVHFTDMSGASDEMHGLWVGLNVGLQLERRLSVPTVF